MVPQPLLRLGIRHIVRDRLHAERRRHQDREQALGRFVAMMANGPIALSPQAANDQHYEVPPAFFEAVLGPQLKYSSAYFPPGVSRLADAETAMLELTMARAGLADGQRILELGCGWGSLTLAMAQRFPRADIVAVSNSRPQAELIRRRATARGLANVRVLTCDVNRLELPAEGFDRCVSVEMFEHMRNYATLLGRIGGWLRADGKLFVHIFCHRTLLYPFETAGEDNWMGRHFFTGGLMPAADTLLWFQDALRIDDRWLLDGTHYQRTANHWLREQDSRRDEVMAILRKAYGDAAPLWYQRWRMFWMACAELFGYDHGREWMVAHYRFTKEPA